MTRRHRPAALLAGVSVLLLTAAGCSDLRSEIEAETGAGAAPTAPAQSPPPSVAPPSPPSLPSASSAGTTSPGCPPSGLDVVIGGEDAAMGHRVVTLKLWNCGDEPHRVKGHPGLELLDGARTPIDVEVTHESDYTYTGRRDDRPRQLTLAPNTTASAVLHWNNRVTSLDGAPTPGAHILVTPAPGEEPVSLPLPIDLGTEGTLDVTSWAADPVSGR
ncbi:hypothetical protein SSPS47_06940 [Streptomyces sp. S4.7]|uniref:DUF4232 domain-containing protein n=1 Tax=Streptomyces sp. S4.7 TaxID=2705439 RepID=UPI001397CBA3|nr:DUF4232 domain-containing protein [Streptomyces sp. S4.7]QHY94859.1 hypothetical protein SSPS47_06940 [Streptomyces sp. S4.7]